MTGLWLRVAVGLVALTSFSLLAAARYEQSTTTLDPRLQARKGSRLLADGQLEPGARLDARAAGHFPALLSLSKALALTPPALVPSPLLVDVAVQGRVARVEFHSQAGSLLLGQAAEDLPTSVWLHELGHARMRGARPTGALGRRLLGAIDEGAADYFAACLGGSPRVGDATELRDLSAAPRLEASEWASLIFPSFDAHRMGWALAARLYEAEPRPGPLLNGLVACLDGESELYRADDTPAASVQALLAACPADTRERLSAVLAAWLPAELSNPESLP